MARHRITCHRLRYPYFTFILFLFSLIPNPHIDAETISDESAFNDIISSNENRIKRGFEYIEKTKPKSLIVPLKNILIAKNNNGLHPLALDALKLYPPHEIIHVWKEILEKTPSFLVKVQAIQVLTYINTKEIIPIIAEQLKSPFTSVREAAIQSLKKFRDDRVYAFILNLAASDNPIFTVYALNAIYHMYDSRLYNFLLEQLKSENKSIRYHALLCLEKNELNKSLPYISQLALKDENSEMRVKAIEILANAPQFNSLPIFLQCLHDDNRDIRYASIQSIAKRKFKQTASHLSNQLYHEKEDDIKGLIMDTLVDFKDGGGYKGFSKIIRYEGNPNIKVHAAYCIGKINQNQGLPILIDATKDIDYRVRAEALHALSNYKENRSAEVLLSFIETNDNLYVRSAALYSLQKLKIKTTLLPLFRAYTKESNVIFKELLKDTIEDLITHITR
ncbi:MAG: HEAT repeat domain-containing protein [Spirochaetes bacterium]|nr:HEAT repeat domain-containing protein [Spirochaetota bacterium]